MRRAFTFLELIVVIAIISIILSIGVVKLGTLDTIREKNELRTLVKDLKYARNLAMVSRKPVTVDITLIDGYRIRQADEGVPTIIKEIDYDYLKRINSTFTEKTIIFNRMGRPSNPGTLILQGKNKKYTVSIALASGKINLNEE